VTALYVPLEEEDGSGGGDGEHFMQVTAISEVKEYQDVRFKDLSKLTLAGRPALPPTLTFNQKTIWPTEMPPGAEPARLLADAMNPGLGVRKLHPGRSDRKGANVAIIDQPFIRIIRVCGQDRRLPRRRLRVRIQHAWPAVASLLVGAKCGTAPEAQLYYVAAPSWTGDSAYYGKALDWITDQNEKLPRDRRSALSPCPLRRLGRDRRSRKARRCGTPPAPGRRKPASWCWTARVITGSWPLLL